MHIALQYNVLRFLEYLLNGGTFSRSLVKQRLSPYCCFNIVLRIIAIKDVQLLTNHHPAHVRLVQTASLINHRGRLWAGMFF